FALSGFGAQLGNLLIGQTQDGCHGALASRHRLLHQLTAPLNQTQRVGKRNDTGGDQGGILPQAVPGNKGGAHAAVRRPYPPERDGSSQNRRQGAIGAIEIGFRTVLAQLPEVVSEGIGSLGKGLADLWMFCGKLTEHAYCLGALSREYESEGLSHATF